MSGETKLSITLILRSDAQHRVSKGGPESFARVPQGERRDLVGAGWGWMASSLRSSQ